MASVSMTIQLLETFRDRNMWKEGFMTHEDSRETRKNICGYAIETIKAQQKEIERLKIEKDEAYHKGFLDGQNNILEAEAEGL